MTPDQSDSIPGPAPIGRLVALCILAALVWPGAAAGQNVRPESPPAESRPESQPDSGPAVPAEVRDAARAFELQQLAFEAFQDSDFARAEAHLRDQLTLQPDNFVVWYNLACARSMQHDAEQAGDYLVRAVELGFSDLSRLKSDAHLFNARDDEDYKRLVDNWPRVLEAQGEANLAAVRKIYGDKDYRYSRDDGLRLMYASAFDDRAFEEGRAEIARIADWGMRELFPDLADTSKPDPWVVVILPTRRDFLRWAVSKFGPAAVTDTRQIGGSYSHDSKRLVAQDLGGTFRHEFFHVLHWRSASRLGQDHPVWIQEGLCSLVEDYDMIGGELVPAPSWRTNTVRNLARAGGLLKIEELAAMPRDRFTNRNPLANYAQARAFFLFLDQRGKLGAWYRAYTTSYRSDPTGVAAVEEVLGLSIDEINADYRRWVQSLPEVADMNSSASAPVVGRLGVEVDPGAGEGPVVSRVSGQAARRAGLKIRDVITSINGRPTRELSELFRVMGDYAPGDTVEVGYRRGKTYGVATVTLSGR